MIGLVCLHGLGACDATNVGDGVCGPDADCLSPDQVCESTTRVIAIDDPTPEGFTVREVLEALQGEHEAVLRWDNGPAVGIKAQVIHDGGKVTVTEYAYPNGSQDTNCSGADLEVDAQATVTTDDGRLDEAWPTIIAIDDDRTITWGGTFEVDALQGSFARDDLESIWISIEMTAGEDWVTLLGWIEGVTATEPGVPGQSVWVGTIGSD